VGLYKRLAKFDAISSQDPNVALFTYSSKKLCSFLVCFDELLRNADGDTVDAALHHLDSLVADTSRLLDRAVAIDGLDGGWRNVKTMTPSILLEDLPHLLHDAHEGDDIHGTRLHVSWEALRIAVNSFRQVLTVSLSGVERWGDTARMCMASTVGVVFVIEFRKASFLKFSSMTLLTMVSWTAWKKLYPEEDILYLLVRVEDVGWGRMVSGYVKKDVC
jgi:hypothetical protein